jgi:hypothetical protein
LVDGLVRALTAEALVSLTMRSQPAIMLTAGPRRCGDFQGRSIVTSDVWT